jgi:hypothetical protein
MPAAKLLPRHCLCLSWACCIVVQLQLILARVVHYAIGQTLLNFHQVDLNHAICTSRSAYVSSYESSTKWYSRNSLS